MSKTADVQDAPDDRIEASASEAQTSRFAGWQKGLLAGAALGAAVLGAQMFVMRDVPAAQLAAQPTVTAGAPLTVESTGTDATPDTAQPADHVVPAEETAPVEIGFQVGQRIPDGVLVNAAGDPTRISDFFGKPTVINVWASWCGPCRVELPILQSLHEATGAEDGGERSLNVVLLSFNEQFGHAVGFLEHEMGVTMPALFEPSFEIRDAANDRGIGIDWTEDVLIRLGVMAAPTTFFLDADGVIRDKYLGEIHEDQISERLERLGVDVDFGTH